MTLAVAAPERLETDRLILRKPVPEDADAIFTRYASDPDVARYMGFPLHRSLDATTAYLERNENEWKKNGAGGYVIESREGRFLGGTGLHVETAHRAATGYVLARDAWGKGYAAEALGALVSVAPRLRIVRLYALTHLDNRPSWRVLEKCGFQREAVLRRHFVFPNLGTSPLDVFLYARIFALEPSP
ncbi:MAG TPA: GNAT family N-acetyltransferase [Candidatus Eisenbacteria bacterium]|nr:GNAT family N-acetyltransferase [Candidatus Eisenbacteria bacterium]